MPPGCSAHRITRAERADTWPRSISSWRKSCAGEAPICTSLPGDPPRIRLHGELSPLRQEVLTPEFVKEALYEIMPKKAVDRFEHKDGADFAYTLEGKGRFRVNIMRQLNGMGSVMRAIPSQALTLDQLDMPTRSGNRVAQQWPDPGHRQDRARASRPRWRP